MGDWSLTITGTGQHHNNGDEKDADAIARETVDRLIEAGQRVRTAEFTSGSKLLLGTNEPSVRPGPLSTPDWKRSGLPGTAAETER